MRSDHDSYKRLRIDLTTLSLRHRRVHDLRRTGITLAREDGADKDVLRFCTHGGPEDIMDCYTSLGWPKLCAQLSAINIERRDELAGATGS
jgi:hypothetical protein